MITFDGIELQNVAPFDQSPLIRCNETTLVFGGNSVQGSTTVGFKRKFECMTMDYNTYISPLMSRIGLKKTLIIDGVPYTNCMMKSWDKLILDAGGHWWYTITITMDTST